MQINVTNGFAELSEEALYIPFCRIFPHHGETLTASRAVIPPGKTEVYNVYTYKR